MMDREPSPPLVIGRYALYDRIASGGMAAVYLGRLAGPVGFARTVAVKRLHAQFAQDPDFVAMFLDEARLAARIQHPNVVSTLDVVATGGELFLVMEYVRGETASQLLRRLKTRGDRVPPRIAAAIVSGVLQGLHAAHEAKDESGASLGIVHRDVSPQNIMVGVDGTPRVLDFGVAKAEGKFHSTRGGEIKGKILYMPPEQLEGEHIDRTTDVYAMGLVLYELLTGKRMFQKSQDMTSLARIVRNELTMPSAFDPALAPWDRIVRGASGPTPDVRYPTARAMAIEVERVLGIASPVEVADWVEHVAGDTIEARTRLVADIESGVARLDRDGAAAALATELQASRDGGEASARSERTAGSQVAQAIDEVPDFRPKSRWRKTWPIAVTCLVLGGAAVYVAPRLAGSSAPSEPETQQATAQPPTPAPSAPPAETASAAAIEARPPTTAEEPPPEPSATPSAEPMTAATHKHQPAATGAIHHAKKPSCDQPYTTDAQGHVHFRTECL
ncbi:MAG TPA: serine/threonine-protein kinase [Polyangiaceae bacterium]|jgi:serine/threonine-protein kinase